MNLGTHAPVSSPGVPEELCDREPRPASPESRREARPSLREPVPAAGVAGAGWGPGPAAEGARVQCCERAACEVAGYG